MGFGKIEKKRQDKKRRISVKLKKNALMGLFQTVGVLWRGTGIPLGKRGFRGPGILKYFYQWEILTKVTKSIEGKKC